MDTSSSANGDNSAKFTPVIPAHRSVAEVTWRAVILGAIISVLFGVANAYLALKFGMTVSSSIPAAVIGMAILRLVWRKNRATVLENNIVQTVGSAGESLAAGLTFTIPAFFIWAASPELAAQGYFNSISKMQIFWLSMLGGSLGILLMIPLRNYLVHKEHGKLRFPEGTACAEIIVAGDEGGNKAKMVFGGIGLGMLFKMCYDMFKLWPATAEHHLTKFLKGGTVGIDATPALLGVGYIIGPRIAALMLSGAVLGYLGVGPLLSFIGDQLPAGTIVAPGTIPLAEMDSPALRGAYIKYLGVGAVSVGGFVSLLKSFPVIISSFGKGFSELLGKRPAGEETTRTHKDIPMKWVLLGVAGVILTIWAMPGLDLDLLPVALAVVFGFLFVVVAARIVGIVGSSSSPVSGMTIATLLVACGVLVYFGAEGVGGMVTAMSVGAVVCIAVCMSGDIAQDLKTGYLLGATPAKQQWTEFIGLIFPAAAMGFVIFYLGDAFGYVADATHPNPLLAPQANIMATIVQGIFGEGGLPWTPILVGGILAIAIELLGVQSLPVAIGLYLPLSLSTPLMVGGIIALLVKKFTDKKDYSAKNLRGILFASGMVAGDGLVGVIVAFMVGSSGIGGAYYVFYNDHSDMLTSLSGGFGPWLAILAFGLMAAILAHIAFKGAKK